MLRVYLIACMMGRLSRHTIVVVLLVLLGDFDLCGIKFRKRSFLATSFILEAPLNAIASVSLVRRINRNVELPSKKRRTRRRTDLRTQSASSSSSSSSPAAITAKATSKRQRPYSSKKAKILQRKGGSVHTKVRELFQKAKKLEQRGQWETARNILQDIILLDPADSHSHLALARLLARHVGSDAATAQFQAGVSVCPDSIHLWQAWALHEANDKQNYDRAKQLFETALTLDPTNPYVCHAYGWMEQHVHPHAAQELWERALEHHSTAALVCSLGNLLVAQGRYESARNLYEKHIPRLTLPKHQTEVYLALAWLEERYFLDYEKAGEWIDKSLEVFPANSMAQIARARLSGRLDTSTSTVRNLAAACLSASAEDGRVYNAWANTHVKAGRLVEARKVLQRGFEEYPEDHALLQAFGTVEGKMGNVTGARLLYQKSLSIQPSAPCLVALALLELDEDSAVFSKDRFEEALTFDRRHGPAYNAYAKSMWRCTRNETATRSIYERGINANCTDAASIYHGFAKFELQFGNIQRARDILVLGSETVLFQHSGSDSPHRDRAAFLFHTLGMIELHCHRPKEALLAFQQGMEHCGKSSIMLLGMALSHIKLGNDEEARVALERSVRRDPCHAQAWHAWAVFEIRSGNLETAKTLLEFGVRKSPRYGALWETLAVLKGRFGQPDEARVLFEKGINVAPNRSSLFQCWASLESREENFNVAKALITKALTLTKHSGSAWIIASEIERQLGNMGLANLLLRRGIECNPSVPKLYKTLGENLVRQRKMIEAREIFEKGISVDPTYAPIYHALAELEASLFNVEGLAALHRRTKELFDTNLLERSTSDALEKPQKQYSNRVPRRVAVLVQQIVGESSDESSEQFYDGPFTMNDEFLRTVVYENDGDSENLPEPNDSH